jgi:hypothetical protein
VEASSEAADTGTIAVPRRRVSLDSQDAFPSLTGAPSAPRSAMAPLTNMSARPRIPGASVRSDDFPRLNRVRRSQGPEAPGAVGPVESRGRMMGAHQRVPASNQRRTAAHVLRQPNLHRVFGDTGAAPGAPPQSTSPILPPDAFPSLSIQASSSTSRLQSNGHADSDEPQVDAPVYPSTGPWSDSDAFPSLSLRADQPATVIARSSSIVDQGRSDSGSARPDPDVSMRAGAVWGGASGQAHNMNRKRGPGRGAPSVDGTSGNHSRPLGGHPMLFPALARAGDAVATNETSSSKDGTPTSKKKSTVIDVSAVARDKKSKSALPKVGGSGHGFAWDRKKMQAKQREVRTTLITSSGESCELAADPVGLHSRRSLSGKSTQGNEEPSLSVSRDLISSNGADGGGIADSSPPNANADINHLQRPSASSARDEFAYFAVDNADEGSNDPTASFFRA